MLLAGAEPVDAVRLQLILLCVLLGASRSRRWSRRRSPTATSSPRPTSCATRRSRSCGPSAIVAPLADVDRGSSAASSRPAASTSATTSARSASTSRARTAARRSTASSTCTRSPSPTTRPSCASALRHGRDPARRRPRSRALHPLPPGRRRTSTPSSRWLLGAVTAWGDLNRMHQWKEKRELLEQQPGALRLRRALQLPGPAGRRRARLPRHRGPGRRRPAPAHRADARDRAPLQRALRRDDLVVPEHRIPEVGARIMDLQDPTRKMSTTGGSEQGTVYVLDEPDAIRKKVEERGHRLGHARSAAATDKAGDREPDRDPLGRSAGSSPEEVEARVRRAPATATSRLRSSS